jgi:hypothetical protein
MLARGDVDNDDDVQVATSYAPRQGAAIAAVATPLPRDNLHRQSRYVTLLAVATVPCRLRRTLLMHAPIKRGENPNNTDGEAVGTR